MKTLILMKKLDSLQSIRGKGVDDSGHYENEDILVDPHNSGTFGGIFGSVSKRPGEISSEKGNDEARTLAIPPLWYLLNPLFNY